MSARALRTAVACAQPADRAAHRCAGCGLTARAAVYRVAHRPPDPRWRDVWTVRAVWSALHIAEADLETQWLIPDGTRWRTVRFCARCAPAGELLVADCRQCGDGPIMLLGPFALPGMPYEADVRERAEAYLRRLGWTIGPGLAQRCPGCA